MTTKTLERTEATLKFTPKSEARPDSDITADVRRALNEDMILRATADRIDARVNDGVVTLRGYVASDVHKARAEGDARQVSGVRQVENDLIADPDLEALVAQRISQGAHLRGESIFVHSTIGVIRLDGQANRVDVADAAERCAASVPNVRAVVNCIQSSGVAYRQPERVLLPRSGQEVYASDGWLGRVEQVVLSPHNRRVMAIIVHVHFQHESTARERRFQIQNPVKERHVLIPVINVCDVNTSGVRLGVTVSEVECCADFDPTKFVMPVSNWQPPLDYAVSDILMANE